MNSVTSLEAKTRFGELLDRVARGEEFVITRREKPVARIVRESVRNLEEVRAGVMGLQKLQDSIRKRVKGKPKLAGAEIREAIAEGRL